MVGRGASNQPLSGVASAAATVAAPSEGFHLDPPLYTPRTAESFGSSKMDIPFYQTPSRSTPAGAPRVIKPAPAHRRTTALVPTPKNDDDQYTEALASLELPKKMHIIGMTREARYLTHCFAGTTTMPPPQLLVHDSTFVKQWGETDRSISVTKEGGPQTSHGILQPELVSKPGTLRYQRTRLPHKAIDNLIICTAENAVVPSLLNLRPRITRDTTICLITPGLGMVEHLNKHVFPDPARRPTFILGHSEHNIVRDPRAQDNPYSLEIKEKKLYLTKLNPTDQTTRWDLLVRRARADHFLELMKTTSGLNARDVETTKFLRYKLPSMVFSSIADAISVALGFQYERIYRDVYAQRIWQGLWKETMAIIQALPELQKSPQVLAYYRGRNFATRINRYLRAQQGQSQWIHMVKVGHALPLQSMNGWFIGRAEELGLSAVNHRAILNMIRAKETARREELQTDIPLYNSPYMLDHDCNRNDGITPPRRIVYTTK